MASEEEVDKVIKLYPIARFQLCIVVYPAKQIIKFKTISLLKNI